MVLVVDYNLWQKNIVPPYRHINDYSVNIDECTPILHPNREMRNVHDPVEYATRVAKMPREKAMQIIEMTPPTSVEAFVALRKIQSQAEEPLVDLKRMMYAIEEYEMTFLRESKDKPAPGGAFPGWSPPLINIWENYDTFMLQPESEETYKIGKICFGSTYPKYSPGAHSVVDKETFLRNFEIFTAGQFNGWDDWNNMVVIGGSMVASLMQVPIDNVAKYYHEQAFPSSDIDVYFYGLSDEEFAKKVARLYEHLKSVNGEILVMKTKYTITFCSQYPKRHIQLVIGKWNNIPEIVFEPDIDCTCVVFDGKDVWATQRSRFSFNHRCIVTSSARYIARGCPEYESRLIKYSKRGFDIWDKVLAADFSNISLRHIFDGVSRILEHKTTYGRVKVTGLRLLVTAYLFPEIMKQNQVRFFLDQFEAAKLFEDEGLPYGPEWDIKKIEQRMAGPVFEDSHYGPYEVQSPYTLIKNIVDWQSIFSPHRDKLVSFRDTIATPTDYREHNFYEYILLSHDMQEAEFLWKYTKKTMLRKQGNQCTNCSSIQNQPFLVYPSMKIICEYCKTRNTANMYPLTTASITRLNGFSQLPLPLSAQNLFNMRDGLPLQITGPFDETFWEQFQDSMKTFDLVNITPTEISEDVDKYNNSPLVLAAKANNAESVTQLLHNYSSFQELSHALLAACEVGSLPIAMALVDSGADVNCCYQTSSPLTLAGKFDDLFEYLQSKGAVIGSEVAMYEAIERGISASKAKLVAKYVANYSYLHNMKCPWQMVIEARNLEAIRVFAEASYLPSFLNCGLNPLQLAAKLGFTDVVKVLLELGAELNPPNVGPPPRDYAVQHKHEDVVKLLDEWEFKLKATRKRTDAN